MAKDVKSNQEERDALKTKKLEKKTAAKKEEAKKSLQHKLIFAGIIVVLALFAALIIFNSIKTSGTSERNTVVASTENFEVTQAMMTYYFNSTYNQYANMYSSSSSSSDALSSFIEDVNNRGTQFTSLLNYTKSSVDNYLTLAEMAKAAGVELGDEEYASIDATIENYRQTKITYGKSNDAYKIMTFDRFLESMFGDSVNESVIRDCLKLAYLGSKYEQQFLDGLTYTDEQLENYYEENKDSYLYVDYLKYTFTDPEETEDTAEDTDEDTVADTTEAPTEDTVEDTTEDIVEDTPEDVVEDTPVDAENAENEGDTEEAAPAEDATVTEARKNAEALAGVKSADEFNEFMTKYFTAEAEKTLEEGKEVDEEGIKTQVENLANTKKLKGNISEEDAREWAYADDTAVGATKLIVDEEKGQYVVYLLTAKPYREEELTKNAAVITLTNDNNDGNAAAKAESIKAEWDAGDKTEDAFAALSEKYSEAATHEVQKNISKSNAGVLADWLFAEERVAGDVGIVNSSDNASSYIVYYAGEGIATWATNVTSALKNDDFDKAVNDYKTANAIDAEAANPTIVTYDEVALNKVQAIKLNASSSN